MTDTPIVIADEGSGMTRAELESHYVAIAKADLVTFPTSGGSRK